ncbi:MAG TPA: hypothetical protein VK698_16810 [Kofleriaceae bacterium]|nr:hypothetical protein [Kofleriaceae bacterium]
MPGFTRRLALILALAAAASGATACATASPRVTVLGVEQAPTAATARHSLLVFVEVVNPTQRDLHLSRLEYRVRATSWFESAGQVELAREVGAGESAVVEIPVPVRHTSASRDGSVAYTLEGKLFALEDHVERSWKVKVRGALGRSDRQSPVRVTAVIAE